MFDADPRWGDDPRERDDDTAAQPNARNLCKAIADPELGPRCIPASVALAPILRDVDSGDAYRDLHTRWQRLIRR